MTSNGSNVQSNTSLKKGTETPSSITPLLTRGGKVIESVNSRIQGVD